MTADVATTTVGEPAATPVAMRWAGRALSAVFALFMAMDIGFKLVATGQVARTMAPLGWSPERTAPIAPIELVALLLYVFPRTAVLGAILLTGVMGGAAATHLRVGDPLFSHVLFGVYLGLFLWGGLWLRDARLRSLFPWRR